MNTRNPYNFQKDDWVNIYRFSKDNEPREYFPAQIYSILPGDDIENTDHAELRIIKSDDPIIYESAARPLDTCLPIELNEEFFLKNNFKVFENFMKFSIKENGTGTDIMNVNITLQKDNRGYFTLFIHRYDIYEKLYKKIRYIHELQHWFREFNINKEFKI